MGRPLDTQSRVLGVFKISELYILLGSFIFGLVFLPPLIRVFRMGTALGIFLTVLLLEAFYFALASRFPDGFFFNLLTFHLEDQAFYPGRETPKEGKK